MVLDWYLVTFEALKGLWQGVLRGLPKFFGSLIVFLIGWFFAAGIGRLISEILKRFKLDEIFEKTGWSQALRKTELGVLPSEFFGAIAKWILVIVFLMVAMEILGLPQFSDFLVGILRSIPDIVIALLIFIMALIASDVLGKLAKVSVEKAGVGYADLAGLLVRWVILGFSGLAILLQLGIAEELITALVRGVIALIVISLGLAFGLGGKDIAAEILKDLRSKFKK